MNSYHVIWVAVFFFKNNLKNLLNVPIDIQNISYMIKNI